ncbi:MAG: sugar ABC transporter permease [Rhodoglobus sp.]|nr:sugar ABC transporter permease [Rhodoglobus sp.]
MTLTTRPSAARQARLLVLPALIFSIVLTQIPFLVTILFSTLKWNQLRPDEIRFAGFDNYAAVFTGPEFVQSLWATVSITGSSVILSLVFGLLLALLLDRTFPGRALARTLIITPFLVMPAAAALIWKWSMLDANVGVVNWALSLVGVPPVAWNTDVPVATIIILLTWQFTPFMMLILLAGLQSQSREVLEAASVDGAGPFRVFGAITLPHLRQYIDIAVLLGAIMLLQVFDPVAIMTKGTGGTKTLPYLLYERAFIGLDVGQAAAFGVITVAITIIVATLALRTLFKVFMNGGAR